MTEPTTPTDLSGIRAPGWLKEMNEGFLAEQRAGTAEFELSVLTVPGRRSGTPRHTPLTVLEHDGARYVLGGFPAADWIRNLRAAGGGTLTMGGEATAVRAVELDAADARPLMRLWPGTTPDGVALMRDSGVIADTTPDAVEAVAGICPMFRLDPVTA